MKKQSTDRNMTDIRRAKRAIMLKKEMTLHLTLNVSAVRS